jgi:diguanylate cyclase (GGDEF)-like protein
MNPCVLLDCVTDSIIVVGSDLTLLYANSAARQVLADGPVNSPLIDAVSPPDRDRVGALFADLLEWPGDSTIVRFTLELSDGPFPVEVTATNLIDDPDIAGVVMCFRDLRAEQSNRRSADRLAKALEGSTDLVLIHDTSGSVVHANGSASRFFGIDESSPATAADLYPPNLAAAVVAAAVNGCELDDSLLSNSAGDVVHVSATVSVVTGEDDEIESVVVVARDISAQKLAEQVLSDQAHRDPLTGLANRAALMDRLSALMHPSSEGGPLALLFVDLDHFKRVNDSLGHDLGDELLRLVAARIQGVLRPTDILARLGGDEFVVVLPSTPRRHDAELVADRITAALRDPFVFSGASIHVTASIGIALDSDDPTRSSSMLLRNADLAMYEAKKNGRSQVQRYRGALRARQADRLGLATDLRQAVARNELDVAYQPIRGLRDGTLLSVEALARWNDPRRGVVPPLVFLDVASDSDLIAEVDAFVLNRAMSDLVAWRARVGVPDEFRVAVNLSARSLTERDLVDRMTDTIAAHGVSTADVTVEITEDRLLGDVPTTVAVLRQLRDVGIRLAIDDFGTGHSSLSYLHQFDVHELKLDRSFVSGLLDDDAVSVIVDAIVRLADTFGLAVIGEGVEDTDQLDELVRLGCGAAQGFLLGEPMSVDDIGELLRAELLQPQ